MLDNIKLVRGYVEKAEPQPYLFLFSILFRLLVELTVIFLL